ncbi:MAG: antitoxin [Lachnospiraceae bacterium]|nr:antitoxin [Lachnospiraceae bacterium]
MGRKYTEAQAKATKKYLSGIGECKLRVSKEKKEYYMSVAKEAGMSLNEYIIQAVEEKIAKEKGKQSAEP